MLTRELGVEWTPVRNGIADIAGVSPQVLRAFSRRRAEIEAELERRGATSAGGAQVAALATRRAQGLSRHAGAARARVAGARGELGFARERVRALLGRSVGERLESGRSSARSPSALAGPTG